MDLVYQNIFFLYGMQNNHHFEAFLNEHFENVYFFSPETLLTMLIWFQNLFSLGAKSDKVINRDKYRKNLKSNSKKVLEFFSLVVMSLT